MVSQKKILFFLILIILLPSVFALSPEKAMIESGSLKIQNMGSFSAQATAVTKLDINRQFSTNGETYPLNIGKIYSLTITGNVNLKSDSSLVRVILTDSLGKEYLIYESYPLISDYGSFSISNICEETCVLNSVTPNSIRFEIEDAAIDIDSISFSIYKAILKTSAGKTASVSDKQKELSTAQDNYKISKMNELIKKKGMRWVAGETSVSKLSYADKKKLFTQADGTVPTELPNLQGFEYYEGGVFELAAIKETNPSLNTITENAVSAASALPARWDWRNVSGEDWMTPVKNQGGVGTCWAFAKIGALESQINLYNNQHLNIDLSEQMVVDCATPGPISELSHDPEQCAYGSNNFCRAGYFYCKFIYSGIADENCDIYAERYGDYTTCDYDRVCTDWASRVWKTSDFHDFKFIESDDLDEHCQKQTVIFSDFDLKEILISKGTITAVIMTMSHSMVLIGYDTDTTTGETIWIFKNSWGTDFGENGYARIKVILESAGIGSLPIGPFIPPSDRNYWPAGFDGTIKCVDKDNDGYCNWGISEQKPDTCPASCKPQKDCDDSNPNLNQFDENYNCITTPNNPVQHFVNGSKVTLTYQGTPPFWINIRGDTNIGQNGGYLWVKTNFNSFTYDAGLATNPSKKFYYGVKDESWSSTNSFSLGDIQITCKNVSVNGNPTDKLDVVFIPIGFNNSDEFASLVLEHIDFEGKNKGILYYEPFKSNKNKFNFYMIDKLPESIESNFMQKKCQYADSYYVFDCSNDIKTWLYSTDCTFDKAILIFNNPPPTGGGWAESLGGVLALTIAKESPSFEIQGHMETVHEFAHLLGLTDEKIVAGEFQGYGITLENIPNCDTMGCSKWCNDYIKNPSGELYNLCKNLSETECKENVNCFWRYQIDEFYKTQCVPSDDQINIGIGCLNGTGCYYNCNGVAAWRSASYINGRSSSMMFYMMDALGFDAVDIRYLNPVLSKYK